MVQIELDYGGDFFDDLLDFLASSEIRFGNLENIDHAIRKYNLVDLKIDVLVAQGLNLPDIAFNADILEDIDCQVYYLGLF